MTTKYTKQWHSVKLICLVIISAASFNVSFAQSAVKNQDLTFGTFCPTSSSGGTVSVSSTGTRSATGNILLFASSFTQATFTFSAGSRNRNVFSITTNSPRTLLRTGGGSMTLTLGTPSPASFTVNRNNTRVISIGGTLTVGSITANPPGSYSGTFALTFNFN